MAYESGHRYVLEGMPWLEISNAAEFFKTRLDDTYEERHRFTTSSNRVQGQLRDIKAILPAALRSHMRKEWFAKQVCRFSFPLRV